MLPLPVETCTVRARVPPAPLASCPWSRSGRAAGLQVPTLLVALTSVRPTVASVRVMLAAAPRPGVVEGDDVAEGLAHGAGADAGGPGDAQVGAVDAAGHRGAGAVAGVGSGWCWSAPPRWRCRCRWRPARSGSGCRRRRWPCCLWSRSSRAAGLLLGSTLLVLSAPTAVSRPGVGQVIAAGCACWPGVVEGDDAAGRCGLTLCRR